MSPADLISSINAGTLNISTSQHEDPILQASIIEKQRSVLQHARHIAAYSRNVQTYAVQIKELALYLPHNGTPYDDYCSHMESSVRFLSSNAQDANRYAFQLQNLPRSNATLTYGTQLEASTRAMRNFAQEYEQYASRLQKHAKQCEEEFTQQLDRRQALWHAFGMASEACGMAAAFFQAQEEW